ncbi:LemA family protein [Candidatus Woesearchaeota archaeon]|nr:LemA family protein [Candidatus Woesearchaeota archaeon]
MIIIWISIGIIVILVVIIGIYNGLVQENNNAKKAWSGIDVQLKRRSDLIPNLVNTVKGYAKHEQKLFVCITQARTAIMQSQKVGNVREIAKTDNILSDALKSLFAVSENYPNLKANENFIKLQSDITETEDQISAARRIFNENANSYNIKVESFPSNIFAFLFGFKKMELFEALSDDKRDVNIKL